MSKVIRAIAFATVTATTLLAATGCSVARDQQSVGSYVDDTAITAAVKAKMAEDKSVSATAISVETLKGVVQLSGFAKSEAEKPVQAKLPAPPRTSAKYATASWSSPDGPWGQAACPGSFLSQASFRAGFVFRRLHSVMLHG